MSHSNAGCKQRILAGNKNAENWQNENTIMPENISAKIPQKISHFFALKRNSVVDIDPNIESNSLVH